jgi:hypothetical protein
MSSVSPAVSAGVVPVVSPDVLEYARKHGIEATVQQLIAVTPRLYPTARSIKVLLKQDPEDECLWFVVFEVRVPQADVPDYSASLRAWTNELIQNYPPPRNHHFTLRLIPVCQ